MLTDCNCMSKDLRTSPQWPLCQISLTSTICMETNSLAWIKGLNLNRNWLWNTMEGTNWTLYPKNRSNPDNSKWSVIQLRTKTCRQSQGQFKLTRTNLHPSKSNKNCWTKGLRLRIQLFTPTSAPMPLERTNKTNTLCRETNILDDDFLC